MVADLDRRHLDRAAAHLDVLRAYVTTTAPDWRYRLRMALAALDLLAARLRGQFDGVFAQVGALPSPPACQSTADVALGSGLRAIGLLDRGVTEACSLRLTDSDQYLREGATLARAIGRPYLEVACLAHLEFVTTVRSFTVARRHCEEPLETSHAALKLCPPGGPDHGGVGRLRGHRRRGFRGDGRPAVRQCRSRLR
jgi:LuxR family maltose regulon positive regulatory protein